MKQKAGIDRAESERCFLSEGQEGETEIETVKSELLRYLNERKYNHAMSKLYVVNGMVFILLGLPLLAGHSKWILLSVAGVVVESIVFIVVYSLVIRKKYKK